MISDELEKTLQRAQNHAQSLSHQYMTLEHLLYSMVDDKDVKNILNLNKNIKKIFVKNLTKI